MRRMRPQEDTMAERPTVLAVATYPDKSAAEADFRALWGGHREGDIDHVAAAVLEKGKDGKLHLDRHDSTAKDVAWGGALVGSALAVVAAPLAIVPLSVVTTQGVTWAGVFGIVGHFWHNIPKSQLLRMSELLESGQAALVIVAVDHTETDIAALLQNATESIVIETDGADIEQAYEEARLQPQSPA
jgi:hypothetical protein